MGAEVLTLAFAMMAGPGMIASIILVTNPRTVRVSAAYLTGIAISVALCTAIAIGLVSLLNINLGDSSDAGSAGTIIQLVLVGLLITAAVRQYRGRANAEPPKWLETLLTMEPGRALKTGLAIIPLMPSDVIIMFVVAVNVAHHSGSFVDAMPFVALTVLIAALPLLAYLLFRRRAAEAMPRVRDWMSTHSWLINIIVCVVFIVLLLGG